MKAILPILLIPCLLSGLSAFAEEPAFVLEARRALAEGIPQVAIFKLETALKAPPFPASERPAALRLLAESQLAANLPDAALETLAPLTDLSDTASRLLRAHAHAATGHWDEALPIYQSLNGLSGVPASAPLGEAESLQALGRTSEAVSTLEKHVVSGHASLAAKLRLASLLVELGRSREARTLLAASPEGSQSDTKWRRYIEARILLLEKKPEDAFRQLEGILAEKTGLSPELAAAATLAAAESRLALSGPDAAGTAAKVLESFIRQNPNSPQLEIVFRRLDQVYARDKNPAEGPLHGFVKDLPPHVKALAQFYVTRLQLRENELAKAEESLGRFFDKYPRHDLTPYAYEMKSDLALKKGRIAEARGTFDDAQQKLIVEAEKAMDEALRLAKSDELRAQFSLRAALINLLYRRDFVRAANLLRETAKSARLRQIAAYDAALSWLVQQNYHRFREDVAAFAAQFSAPLLLGHLRLEEGLMLARTRATDAPSVIQAFLSDFPRHPRQDEGRLALAEIAFQDGRTEEAAALAAAVKGTPETAEQSERLAIFLEDKKRPRDPARVIALARKFIEKHPTSHLLADVRMKLGQIYFTTEDYLHAKEQFATLAREQPTGEYAETALYLSGQCGTKLMNTEAVNAALIDFGQVVARKGPLAASARFQQADIKNKLGDYDAAAKICDSLLGTPNLPSEIRAAALIGKGDNLVALFEKEAPAEGAPKPAVTSVPETYLTQALAAYDTLLATPDLAPLWRNQAAYKKGKSLRALNRLSEALNIFYDILNKTQASDRETFWFSKAGSDAARILQDQSNWEAAVNVYKKMAALSGPHAAQAGQQVKKLRAEHYLFD